MYRYIGNKSKLLEQIVDKTRSMIGNQGVIVDLMSGTGTVALEYRRNGYSVIASDVMTYSRHHLNVNLRISEAPLFKGLDRIADTTNRYVAVIDYLNSLEPLQGFFHREFSPGGKPENGCDSRKYFTSENAAKIDAIRAKINEWIEEGKVNELEESLLLHSLIMAANRVANISGTYGYFLSSFKKNSLEPVELRVIEFEENNAENHIVKQGYAEELSSEISADLCYIDPPYMKRQYAANYHILETIARGDFPDAVGKSGLRDWWDQHSKLCTKTKGLESFDKIIGEMDCKKFIISYSEDGLFSLEQLVESFSKFGRVKVDYLDYNRFKSNQSALPKKLKEYIITIEK